MNRPKRNWRVGLGAVGIWVAVVGTVVWRSWPEPSLTSSATSLVESALAGDAKTVALSIPASEREQMGITQQGLEKAIQSVVLPAFQDCRMEKSQRLHVDPTGIQGVIVAYLRVPEGHTVPLAMGVEVGDTGRVVPFEGWLRQTWRLEAARKKRAGNDFEHFLHGMEVNAPKFREAGLSKIACSDGSTRTVDELTAWYKSKITPRVSMR